MMWLLVGLGNPGKEYAQNRHNIGFMVLDALHAGSWSQKFQGQVAETFLAGEKHWLLKPQTYMNLSGTSVAQAASFYKIPPAQVVVLHDELDLPLGKLRVKQGGGHGGHNGLKSIDAHLGKDYWRVRMGIGHPGDKAQVTNHVLGNFSKAEQPQMQEMLDRVVQYLPLLLQGDAASFMNRCTMPDA